MVAQAFATAPQFGADQTDQDALRSGHIASIIGALAPKSDASAASPAPPRGPIVSACEITGLIQERSVGSREGFERAELLFRAHRNLVLLKADEDVSPDHLFAARSLVREIERKRPLSLPNWPGPLVSVTQGNQVSVEWKHLSNHMLAVFDGESWRVWASNGTARMVAYPVESGDVCSAIFSALLK